MSPYGEEEATTEQVNSVEGAAVEPEVGVSQRVRTGPKKKKDLGTMGRFVLWIIVRKSKPSNPSLMPEQLGSIREFPL